MLGTAGRARAFDGQVIVEMGDGVETRLDVRATRRLIALELADVHGGADARRRPAALYFRVLPSGRDLRVELWENGEFHGARVVSGANPESQLAARRVALAAGELARLLEKKRLLARERERGTEARRRAEARAAASRAPPRPFAVRPTLGGVSVGAGSAWLVGPRVAAELAPVPELRLDVSASALGGGARHGASLEWFEVALAASRRLRQNAPLAFDLGFEVAAAVLRFNRVDTVDAIAGQRETWSARAALALRAQPRVSRTLWLSAGLTPGVVLRRAPYVAATGNADRIAGLWLGAELGVVFSPR